MANKYGKRNIPMSNSREIKKRFNLDSLNLEIIEDKIQLNFLVVRNIVSLRRQPFVHDVAQEIVSQQFSVALRSLYACKKMALKIKYFISSYSITLGAKPTCRFYIHLKRDRTNLQRDVQNIFARFPQIRLKLISFRDIGILTFVTINAMECNPQLKIISLYIEESSDGSMSCHDIIMKLSPSLKSLTLQFNQIEKYEDLSKRLWQLVSSCPVLEKLHTIFKHQPNKQNEILHFSVVHLRECLKLLKIKRFRCNLDSSVVDPTWLPTALGYNENIRELILAADNRNQMIDVADEAIYPILSRLDVLKTNVSYNNGTTAFDVYPAMSTHYLLKTVTYVSPNDRFEDRLWDLFDLKFQTEILSLIQLYLKLSNQMAKPIKTLLLCQWPKVLSERDHQFIKDFHMDDAIIKLSSMIEYRGLKTIQSGSWTRILFKNADLFMRARIYDNENDGYEEFYGTRQSYSLLSSD